MSGSVRKNGKVYEVVVELGKDPITGKRKQDTKSGFKTKRDANIYLRKWLIEIDENRFVQPTKESFASFITDWFTQQIEKRNKETSVQVKRYMIEKHLIKENPFAHKSLTTVTTYDIDSLYNLKLEQGYSINYIRKIHHNIHQAMDQAVIWKKIYSNPAKLVSLPTSKRKEVEIWSFDEIRTFLDHSEGTRNHITFQLALHTRMRKGEILGLQRNNIDLDKKIIHVSHTLSNSKEKGYYLSTPKTNSSRRKIAIPDELILALKKHRKQQDQWKKIFGPLYKDNNLVITKEDGDFFPPSTLTRDMKLLCEDAGVRVIRFHDLRHTHASILIAKGVDIVRVSKRLGHRTPKITLETYAHLLPDTDYEVADIIQTVLQ